MTSSDVEFSWLSADWCAELVADVYAQLLDCEKAQAPVPVYGPADLHPPIASAREFCLALAAEAVQESWPRNLNDLPSWARPLMVAAWDHVPTRPAQSAAASAVGAAIGAEDLPEEMLAVTCAALAVDALALLTLRLLRLGPSQVPAEPLIVSDETDRIEVICSTQTVTVAFRHGSWWVEHGGLTRPLQDDREEEDDDVRAPRDLMPSRLPFRTTLEVRPGETSTMFDDDGYREVGRSRARGIAVELAVRLADPYQPESWLNEQDRRGGDWRRLSSDSHADGAAGP